MLRAAEGVDPDEIERRWGTESNALQHCRSRFVDQRAGVDTLPLAKQIDVSLPRGLGVHGILDDLSTTDSC